jgi:hypothetical protein
MLGKAASPGQHFLEAFHNSCHDVFAGLAEPRRACRWAALLKQVDEADPLSCPKCGSALKIIAFIERHQTEAIAKRG